MYFCPCCGYQTLYEPPPGTYLVCPICFWEDIEEAWGLRQAQLNFVKFGACKQKWLQQIRHPTEQDGRDPNWRLLDEKIKTDGAEIIQRVTAAFQGVEREDGISLHEAHQIYLIRDYAYSFNINSVEAKAVLAEANAKDIGTDWREIPDESLETMLNSGGIFYYYLDPKGWRYYLPAFMVWSVRQHINRDHTECLHFTIYDFLLREKYVVLDRTQQALHQKTGLEYFTLLTNEQLNAVYQFLQYAINYLTGCDREEAQKAIEQDWIKLRNIENSIAQKIPQE